MEASASGTRESCRNGHAILGVFQKRATIGWNSEGSHGAATSHNVHDVQAGLWSRSIEVGGGQQAMPLGTDIADLQNEVPRQFPLNGEVVLVGVLRAHVGLKFSEEQDGPENRPIHRLVRLGVLNSGEFATLRIEGVWVLKSCLGVVRRVEESAKDEGAAAEGRLGAELFENQLLDRVIEHTPAGAETGLA